MPTSRSRRLQKGMTARAESGNKAGLFGQPPSLLVTSSELVEYLKHSLLKPHWLVSCPTSEEGETRRAVGQRGEGAEVPSPAFLG